MREPGRGGRRRRGAPGRRAGARGDVGRPGPRPRRAPPARPPLLLHPSEVEPLGEPPAPEQTPRRVLVAGIGNVFLGDDGFGVEVAGRLSATELPPGVHVEDYGIRGMDLAYALAGYDVAILVDAVPRGGAPGTVYVIEAELEDAPGTPQAHGMDPVQVLALARTLGPVPERVLIVGCEPAVVMTGEEEDVVAMLSEPVREAVGEAARVVEELVAELAAEDAQRGKERTK
ncbi:MAG TPA: hydrogenase maturation protease [Solirubrobacteraceae bacterium]|nr:hydrogenase maturation protease [Solirubrobacteraceae bacterium]